MIDDARAHSKGIGFLYPVHSRVSLTVLLDGICLLLTLSAAPPQSPTRNTAPKSSLRLRDAYFRGSESLHGRRRRRCGWSPGDLQTVGLNRLCKDKEELRSGLGMPTMTISLSEETKARLADLARQAGQEVARAIDWFTTDAAEQGWAACAITELGVIRVCAQLPGGAWPPDITTARLLILTAGSPAHAWWPDAVSPVVAPEVRLATTGKQVTDRYLLGFARRNSGRLATFDRALASLGGSDVVSRLPTHQ